MISKRTHHELVLSAEKVLLDLRKVNENTTY